MENEIKKKKNKKVYIPLIIVIAIVLAVAINWYIKFTKYITTDDALIDCNNVTLSSKFMGKIAKLYVDEGDSIKVGQLLVEMDSTDILAQKLQAEAYILQSKSNVIQANAKFEFDKQNINIYEINLQKAKSDLDRATIQLNAGIITQAQFDDIKKVYMSANASYESAKVQLKVSEATVGNATQAVNTAEAQANVISTQMQNTRLYAPFDGIVAKRWLIAGDNAQPGQTILTVNNTTKFWVSAFFEETKLSHIHVGQNAEFTIDAYPGIIFTGKVFYISSNTAGSFSLVPPNNAAGNFTKITQRFQIKVSVDGIKNKDKNTKDYNFYAGMSVEMKLIK